jgi:K+ transporter
VVAICCEHGMSADPGQTSYVLGRARLPRDGPGPEDPLAQVHFAFIASNASSATDFFRLRRIA